MDLWSRINESVDAIEGASTDEEGDEEFFYNGEESEEVFELDKDVKRGETDDLDLQDSELDQIPDVKARIEMCFEFVQKKKQEIKDAGYENKKSRVGEYQCVLPELRTGKPEKCRTPPQLDVIEGPKRMKDIRKMYLNNENSFNYESLLKLSQTVGSDNVLGYLEHVKRKLGHAPVLLNSHQSYIDEFDEKKNIESFKKFIEENDTELGEFAALNHMDYRKVIPFYYIWQKKNRAFVEKAKSNYTYTNYVPYRPQPTHYAIGRPIIKHNSK
ncbi:hypothetical protein PCE1_001311 [Barthelona sp. PCE]